MTASRERLGVVGLAAAGAALALLTATRPWLDVAVKDPLVGSGRLHPTGRAVTPLVPAAALVALAGAVAAVSMRRIGRQVSGLLLVAAGAAMAAAAVNLLADPATGADDAVRRATGRTGGLVSVSVSATGWPWLAVLAALPVLLAGVVTVLRGRAWSGLSARYDAPAADSPGAHPSGSDPSGDHHAAWDALSRGEDPTG